MCHLYKLQWQVYSFITCCCFCFFKEIVMRRSSVSKGRSVRKFRRQAGRTRAANVVAPMRGGWRL